MSVAALDPSEETAAVLGGTASWLIELGRTAIEATNAAALACQPWVGRGNPARADEAATRGCGRR
jgi:hypothetical protein